MTGKKITLYHIYTKNIGEKNLFKTQVAFTTEEEAKIYCAYLNRKDILGDFHKFSYRKEQLNVFKKARTLVENVNEAEFLFENYTDITSLGQN